MSPETAIKIEIPCTFDFAIFTCIGHVGATTLRDRPFFRIARTIGFGSDLPIETVMFIEFMRALLF